MFSLARLIRLLRPCPPTPTPATFSVSLGGVKPRAEDVARDDREAGAGERGVGHEAAARESCSWPVPLREITGARGCGCCETRAYRHGRPGARCVRVWRGRKCGHSAELARLHLGFPVRAAELVLEQLDAVEPVLDVRASRHDARGVPVADRLQMSGRRRIQPRTPRRRR